jgi:hypothetical protein
MTDMTYLTRLLDWTLLHPYLLWIGGGCLLVVFICRLIIFIIELHNATHI